MQGISHYLDLIFLYYTLQTPPLFPQNVAQLTTVCAVCVFFLRVFYLPITRYKRVFCHPVVTCLYIASYSPVTPFQAATTTTINSGRNWSVSLTTISGI